MALRWKMSEKETGLHAVGAGYRHHYLKDNEKEVMLVYPIGGSWNTGILQGYRFKLLGDCFGTAKFKTSSKLFDTYEEAKQAAKAYYLKHLIIP